MAIIREFKGLRPPKELVRQVAELPYDVVNSEEARQIVGDNKYSFYHISKPEIDLPEDIDLYDESVYRKGHENFAGFLNNGILKPDPNPSMYLYTLVMDGRAQTGLVTCISIDDYLNNVVKKHELTREDKENDRMKHMDVLSAQTGLVYLMYREKDSLKSIFEQAGKISPEFDFVAVDGIRHILTAINDPELIRRFKEGFQGVELYIADGHHRAASSVKVGLKRRAQNGNHTGNEEYNYFLGVIFPHDQLRIMPYNRVVADLNGYTKDQLLEKFRDKYSVEKTALKVPETKNAFCVYIEKEWYLLKPSFSISNDPNESLDVKILQDTILDPILGIKNPRKDKRIDFIGGIRGTDELEKLVDEGSFRIAFSLYPTSVEDLIRVSDSGGIMPPKSTWFEPKLRSGLVLHTI